MIKISLKDLEPYKYLKSLMVYKLIYYTIYFFSKTSKYFYLGDNLSSVYKLEDEFNLSMI